MVYSPSTRADVSRTAFRMAWPMFGAMTRNITVNQRAPRLRAASASVVTSMASSPDGQRPVGVRQGQDDVDPEQLQRRQAVVLDPVVHRAQADDQRDGRDGERQQAEELERPADPPHPQLDPDHRRQQQHQHDHAGDDGQFQGEFDGAGQARGRTRSPSRRSATRCRGSCPPGSTGTGPAAAAEEQPEEGEDHVAEQRSAAAGGGAACPAGRGWPRRPAASRRVRLPQPSGRPPLQQRIPVMTTATMTIMPSASRSASLTLASPTSLDRAVLICCGTT